MLVLQKPAWGEQVNSVTGNFWDERHKPTDNPLNAFLQDSNSQYRTGKAQRELTSSWGCILKKLFSCQNKQMDPSPQCDLVFPSSLLFLKDIQWDKLGSKLGNNILCVSRTKEHSEKLNLPVWLKKCQ